MKASPDPSSLSLERLSCISYVAIIDLLRLALSVSGSHSCRWSGDSLQCEEPGSCSEARNDCLKMYFGSFSQALRAGLSVTSLRAWLRLDPDTSYISHLHHKMELQRRGLAWATLEDLLKEFQHCLTFSLCLLYGPAPYQWFLSADFCFFT